MPIKKQIHYKEYIIDATADSLASGLFVPKIHIEEHMGNKVNRSKLVVNSTLSSNQFETEEQAVEEAIKIGKYDIDRR